MGETNEQSWNTAPAMPSFSCGIGHVSLWPALMLDAVIHQCPLLLWHPRVGVEGENQQSMSVHLLPLTFTPLSCMVSGMVASETSCGDRWIGLNC